MSPSRPVPSFLAPFIKLMEGFKPVANLDPDGYGQIGYGHKLGPTDPLRNQTLDEASASVILAQDMDLEASLFIAVCPPDILAALSDGQYAALVDFVYNEGVGQYRTSHLRQLVESRQWADVPAELLKWVYGGGRQLPGLVNRRTVEGQMWTGAYPQTRAQ